MSQPTFSVSLTNLQVSQLSTLVWHALNDLDASLKGANGHAKRMLESEREALESIRCNLLNASVASILTTSN